MYLRMFTVLRANDEAEDNKSAWPKKDNELQKNEISEKEKKKKISDTQYKFNSSLFPKDSAPQTPSAGPPPLQLKEN